MWEPDCPDDVASRLQNTQVVVDVLELVLVEIDEMMLEADALDPAVPIVPGAAAMPEPKANTPVSTNGTGMPIACAMVRSCVVARIQMPNLPYLRKSQTPPMIAADRTAISTRYHG